MTRAWALAGLLLALGLAALAGPASGQTGTAIDLAVTDVHPGDPAVDARREVAATVQNAGDEPVVDFTVTFRWPSAEEPANGTAENSTVAYGGPPLAAGETARVPFDWRPEAAQAGAGHLVAVVGHGDDGTPDNDQDRRSAFVTLPGVNVRPDWDADPIEVEPGAEHSLVFHVDNEGNRNATMQTDLATPEDLDWSIEVSPQASRLLPGDATRFVLTAQPPEDAPAGQAANASTGLDLDVRQEGYADSPRGRASPVVPDLRVASVRELALAVDGTRKRSPGEAVTGNLTVENRGNRPENVTLSRVVANDTAADWNVTFARETFTLDPGEGAETTVQVDLPPNATAGAHAIELVARAEGGEVPPTARTPLDVRVRQIHRADASAARDFVELLPDQEGRVDVRVANAGNGPDNLTVTAQAPEPGWQITPNPDNLTLDPDAEATASIAIRPPATREPGTDLRVPVTVQAGRGDDADTAQLEVSVNVTRGPYLHLEGLPAARDVRPDAGATLDARVVNGGNEAGNGTLSVEAPDDWEASADVGSVDDLAPGSQREVRVTASPPEAAVPGDEAELRVEVDNGPEGPLHVATSTLTVGGPDWRARLPDVPDQVREGERVRVPARVASRGLETAPATSLELSATGAQGAQTLATWELDALDPGRARTLEATWNTTGWAGPARLSLQVDPGNEVTEEAEADNEAQAEVTVTRLRLAVQAPAPREVTPGARVQTPADDPVAVHNKGNRPADVRILVRDEAGWVAHSENATVPAGGTHPVDLAFPVPRPTGRLTNNVTVAARAPATDAAANATWKLSVRDLAPPRVTGIDSTPTPQWGRQARYELDWRDGTGLREGRVRVVPADGTPTELPVRLDGANATFNWTPGAVGPHRLVPVLEDLAGNSAPGLPRTVNVTPPAPPSVALARQRPVSPGQALPLNVTSVAPVEGVTLRTENVTRTVPEPYRIDTTGWQPGTRSLALSIVDALGRKNHTNAVVEVDASAPNLTEVALDPPDPAPGDEVRVRLAFEEPVRSAALLLVVGDEAPTRTETERVSDQAREATLSLPEAGPIRLDVQAHDRAGNEAVHEDVRLFEEESLVAGPGVVAVVVAVGVAVLGRRR